jgi:hypothetical protein
MSLDDFNTNKQHTTNEESQGSHNHTGDTINEVSDAVDAIIKAKEKLGEWPTVKEYDSVKNEIGYSTRGSHFKRQTGYTFNEIKEKAGAGSEGITTHSNDLEDWEVIHIFISAVNEYGTDLTYRQLRSNTSISEMTISERFDMTFNEFKDYLFVSKNNIQNISRKEIKKSLDKHFNENETITSTKISSRCNFNDATVRYKFGQGSLVDALTELGYSVSSRQVSSSNSHKDKDSYMQRAKRQVGQIDDYKENADGYIYLLQCNRVSDNETFYYIGKSSKNSSLVGRIGKHLTYDGHFSGPNKDGAMSKETEFNIQLIAVNSVNQKQNESDEEFDDRLHNMERLKYNEACSRGKLPTKDGVIELPHEKLLGGK